MRASAPALWTIALTLTFVTASPAAGDWGPEAGQQIPHTLAVPDHNGTIRDVDALSGDEGLAIFFVRSADWCPFCKRQLIELNQRVGDFRNRGINVIAVSYDDVEVLADFAAERGLDYPLLSDSKSEIIRAFGIFNEREEPGTTGYGIPHPGIVITDARGVVTLSFAERSYRKRPRLDDVLAAIDAN